MKTYQLTRLVKSSLALVVLAACGNAHAVMPANEYACQVLTAGGNYALALIQANTQDEAIATAKSRRVFVADGIWSDAVEVVQCIDRPDGRFSDSAFQTVYEKTPL